MTRVGRTDVLLYISKNEKELDEIKSRGEVYFFRYSMLVILLRHPDHFSCVENLIYKVFQKPLQISILSVLFFI